MKRTQGFSLIELLVVIAIMAILITIVIANVGGARGRTRVVAAKATLKQVQAQAELDANGGAYDCGSAGVENLIESAVQKVNPSGSAGDANCQADGANGLAVDLNQVFDNNGFPNETFCVDTNGYSGSDAQADNGLCDPI